MTAEVSRQVQSCGELSVGDQIEAWHNGRLFHRGEVVRTVAATDLFWILDERTGTRRLIDSEALVIVRVAAPAATSGAAGSTYGAAAGRGAAAGSVLRGLPAVEAPEAVRPASHVPLFQAPALVP
ncbi:hypothetical protein [Arthrobacter sp. Leaf69]|uniref:hypothetical protein n=1 Tax=Arthrobacter sp. Leaf69 TaxID=1736232 RepID=UPI001F3C0680|nr:hypothetical protein [Arthrobacter sp. Leaf69]